MFRLKGESVGGLSTFLELGGGGDLNYKPYDGSY